MSAGSKADAALSKDEREQFAQQGYFVRPGLLEDRDLAELPREANAILALVLNSSVYSKKRNPRLDAHLLDGGRALVRKVQPVNDLSVTVAQLSSDPRLMGPMSELMDDEPVLMEEKLNYKQVVDLNGQDIDLQPKRDDEEVLDVGWQLHLKATAPSVSVRVMAARSGEIRGVVAHALRVKEPSKSSGR